MYSEKNLKYVNLFSQGIKLIVTSDPWPPSSLVITGHHDVVSSVASWLPISSTILLMPDGWGELCSLREIRPLTPQKTKENFEKEHELDFQTIFLNKIKFNYLTRTPSQNKCFFNNKFCRVWISSSSLTHHLYHPHLLPVTIITLIRSLLGVRLLLLCQFHLQWFYQLGLMVGCQKGLPKQNTKKPQKMQARV